MAGKPQAGSLASESARLSVALGRVVTKEEIRWWKKKGYPLDDVPKLKRKLRDQERQRKPSTESTGDESEVDPFADAPPSGLTIEVELGALQSKLIASTDYETARTIRTQIAGVKDVIKTLRDQGFYVTQESQIRRGLAIGQAIKSLVLKIPSDLPQQIVGLDYPDAVAKCEDYAYSILTELAAAESHLAG